MKQAPVVYNVQHQRRDLEVEDRFFCGASVIDDCEGARDGGWGRHCGRTGDSGVSDVDSQLHGHNSFRRLASVLIPMSEIAAYKTVMESCPRLSHYKTCWPMHEDGPWKCNTEIIELQAQILQLKPNHKQRLKFPKKKWPTHLNTRCPMINCY
jgi:hypothetical protein